MAILTLSHLNVVPWLEALRNQGIDVDLITLGAKLHRLPVGFAPTELRACRLYPTALWNRRRRQREFPNPFALARHLQYRRPDLLIVRESLRATVFVAFAVARLMRIRVVLYGHLQQRHLDGRRIRVIAPVLRVLGGTIATTTAPGLRTPDGREVVMFPPVVRTGANSSVDYRPLRVICVARFHPRKNIAWVVEAVSSLQRRGHPIHLTLIGRGPLRDSIVRMAQLALESGTFTYIERLPNDEILQEMARHSVFALPSEGEPLGFAILEALGQGLVVICHRSAGAARHVERAGGRTVTNPHELKLALEDLLLDSSTVATAARAALAYAQSVLHEAPFVAAVESTYVCTHSGRRTKRRRILSRGSEARP